MQLKQKKGKARIGITEMSFFTQEINWNEQFQLSDVTNRSDETPSPVKRKNALILVNTLEMYRKIVNQEKKASILTQNSAEIIDQLNKDLVELRQEYEDQAKQGDVIVKKRKFSESKQNQKQPDNSESKSQSISEENGEFEVNSKIASGYYQELSSVSYSTSDSFMSDNYFENQHDINNYYELDFLSSFEQENEKSNSLDLGLDSNECSMIAYENSDGAIEYREINQKSISPFDSNSVISITFECNLRYFQHMMQAKIQDLGQILQEDNQRIENENEVNTSDQFKSNENISLFPSKLAQDLDLFPQLDGNISNTKTLEEYDYYKKKRYCEFCYGILEDWEGEWQSIGYYAETCKCPRTTSAKVPGC